ncbi:transmembrane protein 14C [Eleutherodactylus coqui]|uniref:Transmembrane protein 14C n=2 Tax=Eleutherodactylus coqui TaxID=57060 RepID=A0A8J6EZW0_ELECQ|nr:hypothetical protein GDO78_012763 [Eleutherodactylus coqui]
MTACSDHVTRARTHVTVHSLACPVCPPAAGFLCSPTVRMGVEWFGFSYAALVASGGVIGYVKAGSVPSLAAGLLFGGLAGLGAYQMSQDPKNILVSLIASGTLAGVMGYRFYNSGKFMPAGLIAGASLLMLGRLGVRMLQKPHEP